MCEAEATPATKRRWFAFSLRALMIGVTVLCCWLGWEQRRIGQRAKARQWIESHGGVWDSYELENSDPFNAERWWFIAHVASRLDQMSLSRRILRDQPILFIAFPTHKVTTNELDWLRTLFPEAYISEVEIPGH